jgi:acetyl-CoA synthetase
MGALQIIATYEEACRQCSWQTVREELRGLPHPADSNIAYLAVDRHAQGASATTIALRAIASNGAVTDLTYADLQRSTSAFANVLRNLGLKRGERVFALAGRIPALYIAALGTLKFGAVFCPLFSVFGPEPIIQRLIRGDARLLVTTSALFERKIKPHMDRIPSVRFVLLTDVDADVSDRR